MKIESSQVAFAASHQATETTIVREQILARARPLRPAVADRIQLSPTANAYLGEDREDLQDLTPQQRIAVLVLEAMLGQKVTVSRGRPAANPQSASGPTEVQLRRRSEFHHEAEQTSFEAQGVVQTTGGRTIRFSANLTMQREFAAYQVTTRAAATTDPLVVNFGGAPARLTDAKIAFDLDADGTKEEISFVAAGSAFLALDTNENGKIDDGRELFGPQTGNGFTELAAYDDDGNGWIDTGDAVFSKLKLWTQGGLTSLTDRGIGAIFTGAVDTPFSIKDDANLLQGQIRSTGVYLAEGGDLGTVQQVDLATTLR